jgi:hypothetical protein
MDFQLKKKLSYPNFYPKQFPKQTFPTKMSLSEKKIILKKSSKKKRFQK